MADQQNMMRALYRELSKEEAEALHAIKAKGTELYNMVEALGSSRELSIAKTKLEEAVMWATKHITAG